MTFPHLCDAIEVSDSVLSKHATRLEDEGYVKILEGYVGRRPRTWLLLTRAGRTAYRSHLDALRTIAGGHDGPGEHRSA